MWRDWIVLIERDELRGAVGLELVSVWLVVWSLGPTSSKSASAIFIELSARIVILLMSRSSGDCLVVASHTFRKGPGSLSRVLV